MASTHTVKQGEHICRIAAQYGFTNYRALWNHPKNSELVNKRKNPDVLYPGDQVFIPDKRDKTETVPTEKIHNFRLLATPLKLRIVIKDFDNEAIKDTDCELEIEGVKFKLKSNAEGLIEHAIPYTAENGKLRIDALSVEIPVKVGFLDPVDEESGLKGRLINLGYYNGEEDPLRIRYAIEEFQCDRGIKPITGEFDAATKAKLKQEHGS
jgi:hypothetical protein